MLYVKGLAFVNAIVALDGTLGGIAVTK